MKMVLSFRYMDNNLIEEIPTGFLNAQTSLRLLHLEDNNLKTLEPGVFDNLTSLTELLVI